MMLIWRVALATALATLLPATLGFEKDMTVTVEAGRTDCFYQHADVGQMIDIEYQVIDSTMGELEISFQLTEPAGRVVLADYKKPENSHRHAALLAGDYRFCFDNTFSTFSTKTVFFDLMIGSDNDENSIDYDEDREMELQEGQQNYLMRVGDIVESVGRVKENIGKAKRMQELISANEARDRNLAEDTNSQVLLIAVGQLVIIVTVSLMQLAFVKRLFGWEWEWARHVLSHWR